MIFANFQPAENRIWVFIRGFILAKNLSNVMNVTFAQIKRAMLPGTNGSIQEGLFIRVVLSLDVSPARDVELSSVMTSAAWWSAFIQVEKRFKCDECDYATNYKCNLKQHELNHTGEKPFECNFCEKKFSQRQTLENHRNMISKFVLQLTRQSLIDHYRT